MCSCFLPDCAECHGLVTEEAQASGATKRLRILPVSTVSAVNAQIHGECCCFLPLCLACQVGQVPQRPQLLGASGATEDPLARCKRALAAETLQDSLSQETASAEFRSATRNMAVAFEALRLRTPRMSALEMLGRRRGERWIFVEIYGGCGHFTMAVRSAARRRAVAGMVGPSVDCRPLSGADVALAHELRLQLDLSIAANRSLLWAALLEALPSWAHAAPPCTFWCQMSRGGLSRSIAYYFIFRYPRRSQQHAAARLTLSWGEINVI